MATTIVRHRLSARESLTLIRGRIQVRFVQQCLETLISFRSFYSGAHPFSCDQCGTGFTTSSSLLKHKRIHSGEVRVSFLTFLRFLSSYLSYQKPYACDFCPMRFTALGTLRNHTRTHTGEKPHKCRYCKRAFTQKSDMSAHERTHTGDRLVFYAMETESYRYFTKAF